MRVVEKFKVAPSIFSKRKVVDAGAGAGDQSRYLLSLGADVISVDLSPAIDVVASKLRMHSNWVGVQADIMRLPFADKQFDMVYCEGVIQHTADSAKTVKELCRIISENGIILAAHYVRVPVATLSGKIKRQLTSKYYEYLRKTLSRMERFKLLFATGVIAGLNYVPIVGWVLRKTGTALYYDLMPDFKTTWTNTYDFYGSHAYQRIVTPEEFYAYFEATGCTEIVYRGIGNIVARKISECDCKQ
jgi:ubiquinone/menaquinone biosynthesis C-methylase UbiE